MSEFHLQNCRLDNRYDILECISRGSYAELYVAHDARAANGDVHKTIVVKALNPHLQGEVDAELEQTLLENFRNEAVALDRVRHPHIISRLGHGTAIDLSGRTFHYIVIEYMPGGDLAAHCRRRPLDFGQTLFYIEQVCAGLAYAHQQGVIHRDIKPQNLLLTADRRRVKITDFGVAKIKFIAALEGAITRVGTDVYAAPEHHPLAQTGPLVTRPLAPLAHLTPAADVYSLAKTVYMLLTGEAPRRFAQRTITDFPPLIANEPWAHDVLDVLTRATRINAGERTQTVDEFWREMNATSHYVNPASIAAAPDAAAPPQPSNVHAANSLEMSHTRAATSSQSAKPSAFPASASHTRPRIVVDFAPEDARARHGNVQPSASQNSYIEGATPKATGRGERRNSLLTKLKTWLVAIGIMAVFAGMLYATYVYMNRPSRADAAQATGAAQPRADAAASVGREFVTTTDVNLRSAPGATARQIGIATGGSRVRVLTVREDWYEVRILQNGRQTDDVESATQGWLNSRFLK